MLHLSDGRFDRKQLSRNVRLLRPRHSLHALEFVWIHFDKSRQHCKPIFKNQLSAPATGQLKVPRNKPMQ